MRAWSLARRLAAAQLLGLVILTLLASWISFSYTREGVYRAESDRVLATARLLAQEQEVVAAYESSDPSRVLEPLALEAADRAGISWVTFLTLDGTRLSHFRPDWVGTHYPGQLEPALSGTDFVETSTTGTAGPSVRALVPIRAREAQGGGAPGRVIGIVSVGQTVSRLDIAARAQIPTILGLAAAVAAVGLLASWALNRYLDRTTFGLGPRQLAENFTFLDTALHNVNVGIVLLAPDGSLGLYNDRAAELLGLPPSAGTGGLPTTAEVTAPRWRRGWPIWTCRLRSPTCSVPAARLVTSSSWPVSGSSWSTSTAPAPPPGPDCCPGAGEAPRPPTTAPSSPSTTVRTSSA
ncbi:hypothetical protein [Raineyella fluvialis]|uniref:hypothetical protein n=1 Tax=Raineyella fluvialis TaxID=2662261 RepID=UPI00188FBDC5|nr:hypothetical protein [Raineyella fluvialis]